MLRSSHTLDVAISCLSYIVTFILKGPFIMARGSPYLASHEKACFAHSNVTILKWTFNNRAKECSNDNLKVFSAPGYYQIWLSSSPTWAWMMITPHFFTLTVETCPLNPPQPLIFFRSLVACQVYVCVCVRATSEFRFAMRFQKTRVKL